MFYKKSWIKSDGTVDLHAYYGNKQEIMVRALESAAHIKYTMNKSEMFSMAKSAKALATLKFQDLSEFMKEYGPETKEYKLFSKYLYWYIENVEDNYSPDQTYQDIDDYNQDYRKELAERLKDAVENNYII